MIGGEHDRRVVQHTRFIEGHEHPVEVVINVCDLSVVSPAGPCRSDPDRLAPDYRGRAQAERPGPSRP